MPSNLQASLQASCMLQCEQKSYDSPSCNICPTRFNPIIPYPCNKTRANIYAQAKHSRMTTNYPSCSLAVAMASNNLMPSPKVRTYALSQCTCFAGCSLQRACMPKIRISEKRQSQQKHMVPTLACQPLKLKSCLNHCQSPRLRMMAPPAINVSPALSALFLSLA